MKDTDSPEKKSSCSSPLTLSFITMKLTSIRPSVASIRAVFITLPRRTQAPTHPRCRPRNAPCDMQPGYRAAQPFDLPFPSRAFSACFRIETPYHPCVKPLVGFPRVFVCRIIPAGRCPGKDIRKDRQHQEENRNCRQIKEKFKHEMSPSEPATYAKTRPLRR